MVNKIICSVVILVIALFMSAVPAFAQTVTFTAAGDFANGNNFGNTVNTVGGINPNFHLALGDFSYSDAAGAEDAWCTRWRTRYNNVFLIAGNHDTGESRGGSIDEYTQFCPFTFSNLVGVYGKRYYFDYPATNPIVRVIMISPGVGSSISNFNSYNGTDNMNNSSSSYNWTKNAIRSANTANIPWVVVGMHKNYISMLEKNNEVGTDLMKLLFDEGVDLILQGHEHGYERSKQLDVNTTTCVNVPINRTENSCIVPGSTSTMNKDAGTIISVVGTGGQGLRSIAANDPEAGYFALANNNTYGVSKFTLTSTQLSHEFVKSGGSGSLTDNFIVRNCPTCASPTPTPTPSPTPVPPTPTPVATATPLPSPSGTITQCGPSGTGRALSVVDMNPGNYYIWSRVKGPNASRRFWVQTPYDCVEVNASADMPDWTWVPAGRTVALSGATQNITFIGDHPGVKLDNFLLTQVQCTPTGQTGANCLVSATATPGGTSSPVPTSATALPSPSGSGSPGPLPEVPPVGDGTTFTPIADTRTLDKQPTRNYGSNSDLRVNNIPSGLFQEIAKAYLMFDISSFQQPIQSAVLRVYVRGGDSASSNVQSVKLVEDTAWGETTLNHNNAPGMGRILGTLGPTRTNTWYDIPIPVDALLGRSRVSFGIENCPNNCRDGLNVSTKETSQKPQLILNGGGVPQPTPQSTSESRIDLDDDDDD